MPIKIIKNPKDNLQKICSDKDHNPPMYYNGVPGTTYRHTCPRCGKTTEWTEPIITC